MAPLSQKTILYAALGGLGPTFLWLWFWVKETKNRDTPVGLIIFTFLLGMIAVIFVLPIQKLAQTLFPNHSHLIIVLAIIEEVAKYTTVAVLALHSKYIRKPIDYVLYFVVAALGFAAMENVLFIIEPVATNQITVVLLTRHLRFLGATILHAVTSGVIGISLGLAMYKAKFTKFLYLAIGLSTAIALHSVFNFFIIRNEGVNTLQVFGLLWVVVVFLLLLIEKLRRMSGLLD